MFIGKITKELFLAPAKKYSPTITFGKMKKAGYGKVPCVREKSFTYFLFMGEIYVRTPSWATMKIDLTGDVEYSEFLTKLKQDLIFLRLDR